MGAQQLGKCRAVEEPGPGDVITAPATDNKTSLAKPGIQAIWC